MMHTQAQMLWHMRFNELLGEVELFTRWLEYWDSLSKRGNDTTRRHAGHRAHEVTTGLDEARNKLEAFVTCTPYPKGEE